MKRNSAWVGALGGALAAAAALAACGPGPRDTGGDGGMDIDAGGGGGGGGGDASSNSDGCSDAAKLIYVVDQSDRLSQFDPISKQFIDLGILQCPAAGSASPFSMGIARDATAWVLYSSGELFHVDTANNLACTRSGWTTATDGNRVFGMGFSTDAPGGSTDTLFIAGGEGMAQPNARLSRLDLAAFSSTSLGMVTGWPELTGTGAAELWGFIPATAGSRIVQFDKSDGSVRKTYPLTALAGEAHAWAFAFHGGSFWVFLKKGNEASTTVYQVDAATGQIEGSTPTNGRSIVGAGVSTCAPIIL